uniref:MYND-type domain-containing protein n=1 Tax=Culex tarsalis TaxID=7177 RepID=A0A1Q3F592_CULTA
MHVMEEGSDATLVCSADATTAAAAAKVVSLKTSSVATSTPVTTTSSKSPAPEEARLGSAKPEAPLEEVSKATGPVEEESKKKSGGDENKENMTVKDNAAVSVVEEKVKQVKEDENKKGKESEDDEVMSGMMDDLEGGQQKDCTYRNGSKTEDFNDELTFQMDVDGGSQQSSDGGGGDDTEEDEDDEEEEESGAVDLSSSTETVNKPVESSPEKSSTKVDEPPVRKPEVPVEKPDLSSAKKVVKVEPVEMPEERREEQASVDLSSKTSPKEKPVSRKRRRSVEEYEDEEDAEPVVPSKKLKRELECNFRAHDRLLKEYIETTSNDSMEDVQKNTELLMVEIQTLNDMIRAKENEWNNMIHLKKVKEEILMRLTRKKNVLNIVQTKLGEEPPADYSLSNVRSASVGPRPPTPPPEVDIRPASVTPLHNSRQSAHSSLLNDSRRHSTANASSSSSANIFAQFNHINSSVTMVPLSTSPSLITSTNTILQSRANMKPAELAKEKPNAAQIQRQILPKPILSNHQQILNNLAMSAGLTAANATSSTISNSTTSTNTMAAAAIAANNILAGLGLSAQAAALLNGHHNPGQNAQQQNHLQVGRQGVIKDVKSIIADYRQKHPEQVPRRGRRLKNIPSSSSSYDGKGSSADARMRELSFLLAAAEDDEAEDSVDRLVIDEGDDHHHDGGHVNNSGHHLHQQQQQRNHGREPSVVITTRGGGSSGGNGPEFHENDVPECQGCKKREAQFVCAGCGNQWYCSRECQVNAWDDHSEVCTG